MDYEDRYYLLMEALISIQSALVIALLRLGEREMANELSYSADLMSEQLDIWKSEARKEESGTA